MKRWVVVGGVVVAAVLLASVVKVVFLSSESLTVQMGDFEMSPGAPSGEGQCEEQSDPDLSLSGTRFTVKDESGDILGSGRASGDGHYTVDAGAAKCLWTVKVEGLDDSEVYLVTATIPSGAVENLTFTKKELERKDWTVQIKVNYFG